ncbi:hypothetical protein Dimus_013121 [Dionaea muscipula]
MDGENKDGVEGEEDESMNEDGPAVGLHSAELERSTVAGNLTQQAGRQQHEQHHPYQHRRPVRHHLPNPGNLTTTAPTPPPPPFFFGMQTKKCRVLGVSQKQTTMLTSVECPSTSALYIPIPWIIS